MKHEKTTEHLYPGTPTPVSGQYLNDRTRLEVTSVEGHPLPPGPPGSTYSLVDATRHKGE
jgi:hypothetical protein